MQKKPWGLLFAPRREVPSHWRWTINNRLPWGALGWCQASKRTIHINHRIHCEARVSLLSTCIHEDLHRVFPEKREYEIEELTDDIMALLSARDKRLLTARYRRKLGI